MHRKLGDRRREADEEIRHVRGLVLIRTMLAERGASAAELSECDAVIADCRGRLAEVTARGGAYAPVAA